jgi:hypothetical protein
MITNRAIMAMDPGGKTGVAWGIFDVNGKSPIEAIATRMEDGSCTVDGREEDQIRELALLWRAWLRRCVAKHCMPEDSVELVIEDFQMRKGDWAEGTDIILPVRVTWGLIGYRLGQVDEYERGGWGPALAPRVILQQPSQASTYATDDRLKRWGLWVRGREHERSAWRHVACRVNSIVRARQAR